MAAKEKVSTMNRSFINNVTRRSINLLPSLQLTDQPTLRYSFSNGCPIKYSASAQKWVDKKQHAHMNPRTDLYPKNVSKINKVTLYCVRLGKSFESHPCPYVIRRVTRTQTGLEFLNWAFSQINCTYWYVL